MLSFLKKRIVLEILGIVLLSVFIWFGGPYFAFADFRPFAPEWVRLIAIGLVVTIWGVIKILKVATAARASSKLASAVAAQPDPAPSSDEAQLRRRFEEAIAALKESRDHNLYSQPWYVLIGPPGSGKTTLLENSGLQFPLAQRFGREAVRGVGGTRNCDWWFTDDAIFLDTAGRFTTQDSDPGSDSRAWREFLSLLKKYRRRRPVNGVILTVSVGDLLTLTAPGREAQIAAARLRLLEVNRELRIQLPVYLLVTKCDLMAGFTEYFDDLSPEQRKQVWGVTFPYEQTLGGRAHELFSGEFDQLVARLNGRVWQRLEDEREARRRAKIFGLPQQLAALKDVLNQFVTEVFSGTRMDVRALLRGVYFTSGTQEGTPIDRLLGSVGRAFAFEPQEGSRAAFGRGKAYFVERVLKEVILPESGLAGVNRRLELKIAAAQLVAYVAMAVVTVFVVIGFSLSYSGNSEYLRTVHAALDKLDRAPVVRPDASMDQVAARLDRVGSVDSAAERYQGGAPWAMRWGLYVGRSVGQAADDSYDRALNELLLPKIAALFKQRLYTYVAEPEKLYEYLKAYLMLGDPRRADKAQLQYMTDLEWKAAYGSNPALSEALKIHSHRLLGAEDSLRPMAVDAMVVEQARSTIRHASIPRLMYGELKMSYAGDTEHALRLDREAGLGLDRALARRSGRLWSEPVAALYTKKIFDEISGLGTVELVARFTRENWVLGDDAISFVNTPQLTTQLLDLYERDYIAAWDGVVNDLQLPPLKGFDQMRDTLSIIASEKASPLRGLLQTIDANTYLVKPDDTPPAQGLLSQAQKAMQDRLAKLLGSVGAKPGPKPGTLVTEHFAPIHALISGPPGQARIDLVLQKIGQVKQQVDACGEGLGEKSAAECVKRDPGPVKTLSQEARTLPPAIAPLVETIANAVDRAAVGAAGLELVKRYDEEVIPTCVDVIGSRYPFQAASREDVPIADFGRVFGYGGLFDTFYKTHLTDLVDTSARPWRWRPSQSGTAPASDAFLRQFESAQAIRDLYFRPGSDRPEFTFSLAPTALDSDATRVVLDVDGQAVEYRHGPVRATPAKWPGPANGSATISFEERSGGHPNLSYQGPWAWFHLIDAGRLQADRGVRYRLSYAVGGHSAEFMLEPVSIFNPLGKTDLQRFACRY